MWTNFGLIFVILNLIFSQCAFAKVSNASDVPSGFGMRFRLPFIDMDIQSVSNVKLIKDSAGQDVFLLHGAEFYRLILGRESKRMTLVATLIGGLRESELLGAQVISWRKYVILVVATDDFLEVYQFAKKTIVDRTASPVDENAAPLEMNPIQQITLHGQFKNMFLCEPLQDSVSLIVLVGFTKLYSRLNTYEWSETYFDPSEEKTIAPVQKAKLIGAEEKYLVLSRLAKSQNKLTVIVYGVTPMLKQVQALQLSSKSVHPFTYQGNNYMISCEGVGKKCTSFRMSEREFTVYKKRPYSEFHFDQFTGGEHFLVGQRASEVSVYVDARMECYGTFQSDCKDVTTILTHHNGEGLDFIMLAYIQPYSTLLRIVEIEHEMNGKVAQHDDGDELGSALKQQKHAFEENISTLRKILLTQKYAFDEIKRTLAAVHAKARDVIFKNPLRILSGDIGIVKLIGSKLRSPLQILQRLQDLKAGQRKTRLSRGFEDDRNRTRIVPDLSVQKLRVGNLIYEGDLIPGLNLSSDSLHLKVNVPVTTKVLETKELLTRKALQSKRSRQYVPRTFGDLKTTIRRLRVNRINDVSWEHFYQSLFLRSRDRAISGRLTFQSDLKVGDLHTKALNDLVPEKLFNLVDPQNITSKIVISRFLSRNLTVDWLNGLRFPHDVARLGRDNFINSTVVAQDLTVTGNLILSEQHQMRHLFNLTVADLRQTYTGKVVIDGSLTLTNLMMEDQRSQLLVDGTKVPADLGSVFFMHSIPQTFVHPVSFTNCLVSAPRLDSDLLNDRRVAEYLTTGQKQFGPVLLIFLSATIEDNLTVDQAFETKLLKMSNRAVKAGDRVVVSGKKTFHGSLTFDHGVVSLLNDLPAAELVSSQDRRVVFTGKKTFNSINIESEAVIAGSLQLDVINDVQPENFFTTDYRFGTVVLRSPYKAHNIVFNYLNGFPSSKLFNSISSVEDKLILHKDLYIEGGIFFESNLQLSAINGILWDDYVRSMIPVNENARITGRKTIANSLTITGDLTTPMINSLGVNHLLENVLLKSKFQVITGHYTFDTVRARNVEAPAINEFPTDAFVDTRQPEVIFRSTMVVDKLNVLGSLFGAIDTNFPALEQRIKAIIGKPWKYLHVLGNAFWPWGIDQQSLDLQYLFENAVRRHADQVITGDVKLKKPLITTMVTKGAFPEDIDFDYIARDSLLHNSSVQEVVTAAKVFLKPIQIAEATALGHVGIPVVNRIDILELNSSVYRLSQPTLLGGPLIFQAPLIFGHLTVQGTVNDVLPSNVFAAHDGSVCPSITLESLTVEGGLHLGNVGDMNFDEFLRNRVRKTAPQQKIVGHLKFENLIVEKEIHLESINGVAIDNIVHKNSGTVQEISGHKTILGDLHLIGPSVVVRLNGEDVTHRYDRSIFVDRNHHFDSLSIEKAEFSNGLIVSSPEAKHSVDLQDSQVKHALLQQTEILKSIEVNLHQAEEVAGMRGVNPRRLIYLDYDFSTITEWKTTNDSIQEEFIFDNNRYQYCDREQTIVKWSKYHNRISLSKTITNTIVAEQLGVRVTAENACKDSYRNVNSRITVVEPHFTKQFTISKLVQSIEIFYARELFVLVHLIDLYAGSNEIRIFKIDSNLKVIQDWQLLTDGVGKMSKMFKLQSHTLLMVATVIDNYPSVTIYSLNQETRTFEVIQVVDGDYDIIELTQLTPHRYHLFLGCVHCQRIVIFEYDSGMSAPEECHSYKIYQILKLKSRINRFNLFSLPDGEMYLLVLPDQDIDFYHIYKYGYIQGWKHFTYGYFKDIQNAYPLLRDGLSSVDDNLLLLCNRKCSLVKAFYQN